MWTLNLPSNLMLLKDDTWRIKRNCCWNQNDHCRSGKNMLQSFRDFSHLTMLILDRNCWPNPFGWRRESYGFCRWWAGERLEKESKIGSDCDQERDIKRSFHLQCQNITFGKRHGFVSWLYSAHRWKLQVSQIRFFCLSKFDILLFQMWHWFIQWCCLSKHNWRP